jgi:hypothetical protein
MTLNVPVLGYVSPMKQIEPAPSREAEAPERLIVGFEGVTLDGKPFPWATVGDWIVTIGNDHIATLTVQIAISLPADPAAIKE